MEPFNSESDAVFGERELLAGLQDAAIEIRSKVI
jgi:hypothetical protein